MSSLELTELTKGESVVSVDGERGGQDCPGQPRWLKYPTSVTC